ncbi:MAG: carboxylesterase/lipase family protein [Acidimicrobiales bacterium]|nr:carboxylesterase/lipase family protein [Acidimicrobiales bacterium]
MVDTRDGTVEGKSDEGGVQVFRGVPFAAAPVGGLRFAPPARPEPWSGVRAATDFGPVSHQSAMGLGFMGAGSQPQSEDCLSLNVWTPGLDGARRPVMVWFHGGAFILGAGSEPLYDGRRLARRGDVVVVTANYRLGALGYLAHPCLRDKATGACGNWGLLDQVTALEWVRDNIEAFGGDPGAVTVFGESAGSASVTTLMGTPGARGLFGRVIAESGTPWVADAEEAKVNAERLAGVLGIDPGDASAWRAVDAPRFVEAQQQLMLAGREGGGGLSLDSGMMTFRPTVDGAVLPVSPWEAVAGGAASDVDLLIGTNRDEMKLFNMMDASLAELDDDGLADRLTALINGAEPRRAIEAYRAARAARGEPVEASELWPAMVSDQFFRAPAGRFAAAHAAHAAGTYAYLFCWESPIAALGSPHAIELPFVFGTLDTPMIDIFAGTGPEAQRLSDVVQDAWLAFARGGDPSTDGLGPWPGYDDDRRATMVLGSECRLENGPRAEELAVWS